MFYFLDQIINNFYMIPLSNGRSPRIDQFYATLRTYKSHQFQQDHNTRTQEDKSIEHIRSLGKQIFEQETGKKKIKVQKQSISALHRSQQSIRKAPNLYQKYKEQRNKQIGRQVNRMKQIVIKEEANKKVNKNIGKNKYNEVKSKISKKANQTIDGLNYEKKSEMQAQRIKKQKMEMRLVEKQMKQKQMLFEKSSKSFRSSQQSLFNGLLKRAQQMKQRKQQLIQQIRNEQLLKQMSGVTFQPTKISKEFGRVEPVFEKRLSLAQTQRISKEKSILKQVVQEHSFKPQLNQYKSAKPKVENSWKESKIGEQQRTERSNRRQSVNQTNLSNDERNKTSYKSSQNPTANSTMQINLKTVNEISFIFE